MYIKKNCKLKDKECFKIREIEIPNRVVLAPMAGVCNAAFRLTAERVWSGISVCRNGSDKAILFNN